MKVRIKVAALVVCMLGATAEASTAQRVPVEGSPGIAAAETSAVSLLPAPAHLVIFNREVAVLRGTLLGRDPDERVKAAADRIEQQVDQGVYGEVTTEPVSGGAFTVSLGGKWMFYILPADADPLAGETAEATAQAATRRLASALAAIREQRNLPGIVRSVGITAGALLLMLAALRANRRLARIGRVRLRQAAAKRVTRLTVGGLSILDRVRLQRWMHWLIIALSRTLGIVLVYLWIVFSLRQFPFSRPWSERAGGFVAGNAQLGADALLRSLPGLLAIVVIVIVTRWLTRAAGSFFALVESRSIDLPWFHPDLAQPTRRIASAVLWIFAAVLSYPFIPFSDSVAFKGVSILVGVMLSLGSSGIVNQAMSGLVLMYSRALRAGEFVRIGGIEGTVTSLGILSTKIRTLKGEEETIPNSVVVGTSTTNYSRLADGRPLLLYTAVTIGYDTPWRQVHALLVLAAERTAGLLLEPRPFVLQRALSDFFVEYQLNARLEQPHERPQVLSQLHENIQDLFNEHGVQIMSPHYLGDPVVPKLVPRDQIYAPPAVPPAPPAEG